MRTKKRRCRPIQPLTHDEIFRVLDRCKRHTYAGARAYAMIWFFWRSQVRISEACDLEVSDLDLDKGTARVQHGKGDKYRVVAFDQKCEMVLRDWLLARETWGVGQCRLLFPTKTRQRQDRVHFARKLRSIGKAAGLTKRCHAHGFRHTGAMELRDEGVDIFHIQAQLGHENIATTQNYLQTLNPAPMIQAIRRRVVQGVHAHG